MKTQLTAKYLQFLTKKNKNQNAGFTLIELLVVIIIIGILSAIALPSFLNQAAKARGAEAKSNVGAMNRAQQAFFLEQQKFTANPDDLGLSMDNSTDNFTYEAKANGSLEPSAQSAGSAGVSNLATSKKADIKGFIGGTFYTASTATTQGVTKTILCEAKKPGTDELTAPTKPAAAGDEATCSSTNTLPVK